MSRRRALLLQAAAGGPFAVVTDSFNRVDSATTMGNADTGQTWTPISSAWGISANQALLTAGGGPHRITTVDAGIADCSVECTHATLGTDPGIVWRVVDNDNYFVSTATAVFRRLSGTFLKMGDFSTGFSDGDTIKVVVSGTSHEVFRNGASVLTYTNSSHQTATLHGLRNNSSSTSRYADFSVSTL